MEGSMGGWHWMDVRPEGRVSGSGSFDTPLRVQQKRPPGASLDPVHDSLSETALERVIRGRNKDPS